MSVTPAQVLAARPVEVGDDQDELDLAPTPEECAGCPCPTPELCRPAPQTCWKS